MSERFLRVYLVGPMGAGKTSVGRSLALVLGKPFIDLDERIVMKSGMSIPEIFKREGEAGFRRRETAILKDSLNFEAVVATGGGVVVTPENLGILKNGGTVVYLRADVDAQYQRTMHDQNRPMIATEDRRGRLAEIFAYRDPLYRQIGDIIIDSGRLGVRACVAEIRKRLKELDKDRGQL